MGSKIKNLGGHFGIALKAARQAKGVSLRELCRRADLDPGNYCKMEYGTLPPPPTKNELNKICKAIGVSALEKDMLLLALRQEQAWRINHRARVEIDRLNREFS